MKQIVTFLLAVLATFAVVAQTPTLSYQAVVRDGSNKLVLETAITATVNLYNGSEVSPAYAETHSINSDRNGLINLAIGSGGTSHSGDFNAVDWSQAQIAITLSWNGGANTATLPRTTFTVVPTAIYSHTTNYANLPKTETITNNDHTKLVTEGAVKDYVDGQIGSLTNYAELVGDNTFTGDNDFTGGTIIVPTNLSDPIVFPATCTNAANLCDLIAVFDSLKNCIDTLNNQLNRQLDALSDSLQALRDTLNSITHPVITPIITFNEDRIDGIVTIASAEHAGTIKIYDGSNNLVATIEPVNVGDVISTGLAEGGYTVITTNTTGGKTTDVITVQTVTPTSIALAADKTGTIYICSGTPVTVTYTATTDPVAAFTYNWTNSGGTATPSGNTCTVTYSTVGNYTVDVTVKGMTQTITTIVAEGMPSTNFCEDNINGTITLSAFADASQIAIYDPSDVLKKTITAPTAGMQLVTEADNYPAGTYTLVVSNAHCTIEETATIARVHTTCNVASMLGNEMGSGSTLDSVRDHEGNWYDVVQIGTQCWMRENMRATTSPSTNTLIYEIPATSYSYSGKKAYAYGDNEANIAKYGLLYNWNAAVDTFNTTYTETHTSTSNSDAVSCTFIGNRRGICPAGWHLPSNAEWTTLVNEVGGVASKLAGGCNWTSSGVAHAAGNYAATDRNISLFSALPGGRYNSGGFNGASRNAYFWSATQDSSNFAYSRGLGYDNADVVLYLSKYFGRSVRCLRD